MFSFAVYYVQALDHGDSSTVVPQLHGPEHVSNLPHCTAGQAKTKKRAIAPALLSYPLPGQDCLPRDSYCSNLPLLVLSFSSARYILPLLKPLPLFSLTFARLHPLASSYPLQSLICLPFPVFPLPVSPHLHLSLQLTLVLEAGGPRGVGFTSGRCWPTPVRSVDSIGLQKRDTASKGAQSIVPKQRPCL